MKKLSLIAILLLCFAFAFSQNENSKSTVTVRGYVMMGTSPHVNFKVVMAVNGQEGFLTTYTDSTGEYVFSELNLTPGEDTVKVFASGHHTFYGTIMISWKVVVTDFIVNRNISIAHNDPDFTCGSAFGFNNISGNTIQFINMSLDTDNTQYYWDFADGYGSTEKHPIHTYMGNGRYDVSLDIQHNGCSDQSIQRVNIDKPTKYFGHVIYEGSHDLDFLVRLIPKNNPNSEWYGCVTDVNGDYNFIDIPEDEYIIEARPKDMYQYIYPKPITTYFPNHLHWNNADTAHLLSESVITIQTSNFVHSGGNQIECQINDPDNLLENNPSIVLFNSDNEPLTTAIEDSTGILFSDMQAGTYLVYPHYPGKTTIPYEITFTELSGVTKIAEFDVTNTHIAPPGLSINSIQHSFSIYPNPAVDILKIISTDKIEEIEITDLNGKQVLLKHQIQEMKAEINIKNLNTGAYIIRIKTNQSTEIQVFTKK
jgi:PKD repeat protein